MRAVHEQETVAVWDPLIRIFHWSLVVFFFTDYITGDELENVHVYVGYAITALIAFRLIWGLVGSRHARFTDFVTGPGEVLRYLGGLFAGRAKHYFGHNPAGGMMIIMLLISLVVTVISGIALLATDGQGPLAGTFVAAYSDDAMEEVHEVFANLTLVLVGLHIAGVVVSSYLHRENLVKAMLTGRKPAHDPASR